MNEGVSKHREDVFYKVSSPKVNRANFKKVLRKTESLILPSESKALSEKTINSAYSFLNELGRGNYGTVYKACKKNLSGIVEPDCRYYAIKLLCKESNKQQLKHFLLEIDFMKAMDHPNIVKFFECYENK